MVQIKNTYHPDMPNAGRPLTSEEIVEACSNFEFFTSNCQQIVNKNGKTVPFHLNEFQRRLFRTILPMVDKKTRLNKRHSVIVVKSRQVGASVGVVDLINYLCGFADLENMSITHVFPVTDTITKFYNQKVMPIVSGVHPSIFPEMDKQTLGSSIITHYDNIKGVPLNNNYELLSSNSSSIRSSTMNILLEDEVCYYDHPERLDNAILPALPDTGFSLLVYLSTVGEDASSLFFLDKLRIALDNPDDWTVVFVPWFFTYPEMRSNIDWQGLSLNEYERDVLVPAFRSEGLAEERWGDAIDWYRRKLLDFNNNKHRMMLEYPSNITEVLQIGADKSVFMKEDIDRQEKNVMAGQAYRILNDPINNKTEAHATDISPFIIFKPPEIGKKYRVVIDPITAQSEESDNFVFHIFDLKNNEQVATFAERGLQDEGYADWVVGAATLYNKAELCPESNVANGFVVAVNARRYYHWFYDSRKTRGGTGLGKMPGLRTTVSSKELMIDKLNTMLSRGSIILHDQRTLDELKTFMRITRTRADGSKSIRMAAKKGCHDDRVAALWIYAGSLDMRSIEGTRRRSGGFAIM